MIQYLESVQLVNGVCLFSRWKEEAFKSTQETVQGRGRGVCVMQFGLFSMMHYPPLDPYKPSCMSKKAVRDFVKVLMCDFLCVSAG